MCTRGVCVGGGVLLSLQRGQRHSAASCSLPPGLDLRGRRASGVGPPAARKGPAGPGRAGQQCAPGGGNGGAGMGRGAVPAGRCGGRGAGPARASRSQPVAPLGARQRGQVPGGPRGAMSVGKRSAAGRGVPELTGPCGGGRAGPGRAGRSGARRSSQVARPERGGGGNASHLARV